MAQAALFERVNFHSTSYLELKEFDAKISQVGRNRVDRVSGLRGFCGSAKYR